MQVGNIRHVVSSDPTSKSGVKRSVLRMGRMGPRDVPHDLDPLLVDKGE